MSFESDFFDLLKANAGVTAIVDSGAAARVYPLLAPAGALRPYITWQRVSSDVADFAGRALCEQITLQLDCWADSFDVATALGVAVRLAIESSQGPVRGRLEADTDLFEDESRLYRRLQSYVLYHPAN